jgi:metal-dependent amidase/aminoacylase/carboxypeptidase family protein
MTRQGIFKDIDIVMMVHPDIKNYQSGTSKAILPMNIKFEECTGFTYLSNNCYTGLDASLLLLNYLNFLLKGIKSGTSIDSSILSSSHTPSLKDGETEIKLYIRSDSMKECLKIENSIKQLCKCINESTNINYKTSIYELPYDELITNKTLSRLFSHNLKECGIINIDEPKNEQAGLSLGTVSNVVPCIHPYIKISDKENLAYASKEFSLEMVTPYCNDIILKSCKALALTALNIIENKDLLSTIKSELL